LEASSGATYEAQKELVIAEILSPQIILRTSSVPLVAYESGNDIVLYYTDETFYAQISTEELDEPPSTTDIVDLEDTDEEEEDDDSDGNTGSFSADVDTNFPIGGLVGGVVGFIAFMTVGIVIGVIIKKQRMARRQQAQRQRIANLDASKSNENSKSPTPANDTPFQANNNNNSWN